MIVMSYPPVRNPARTWMRWAFPAAWGPDVAVALPAMIAVNPHETTFRWPASLFVHRRRRRNADHNLRK